MHDLLKDEMESNTDEIAQHAYESIETTPTRKTNTVLTPLHSELQKLKDLEVEELQHRLDLAQQTILQLERSLEGKETLLKQQASRIANLQQEKESLQEQVDNALAELAAKDRIALSRASSRPCSSISSVSSGAVPDSLPPISPTPTRNCGAENKVTSPQNAHLWGVTVQQLVDLHDQVIQDLESYCQTHGYWPLPQGGYAMDKQDRRTHVCLKRGCKCDHRGFAHVPRKKVPLGVEPEQMLPNMHVLVDREIKPRTKSCGSSFALMRNPQGLRSNVFITHTWGGLFREFVGTLVNALQKLDVVWICSLAVNQNSDIASLLGDEDLNKSPFAVALKQAEKQVVVLDTKLEVPDRAWCTYEISRASLWGVPTLFWFYQLSKPLVSELGKKVESLDFANAKASNDDDLRKIRKAIEDEGGYEVLNGRLKNIMGDRLRFYQAMGNQDQENENAALGELSQQLIELRDRVVEETDGNDILEVDTIERLHKGLAGQRFLRLRIVALTRQLEDARSAIRRAGFEREDALERAKIAAEEKKLLIHKEAEVANLQSIVDRLKDENEELNGSKASWLRRSLAQIEEIQDLQHTLSKCRCGAW